MKLLVTGGAGFIGSNFIRYMQKKYPKYKITNLDKLTYAGNLDNLKGIKKINYKFIKADICNKRIADKLVPKHDWVINFAAETHVDRSIFADHIFVMSNVVGVQILCDACLKHKTKFLQISTDEVYGSIKKGAFKETDLLNPSSPYSSSKAGGELLAYSFWKTYGLPVRITRSSNNFGPNQCPEKLIPLMITNALTNKKLPVYGTGKNVRDWLFVEDNCSGIDKVLHKGKDGQIYNIGGGNTKPNFEIINLILQHLGKNQSLIKYVKDRPGHDWRYCLNSAKIKKLGWKPKNSFKEALKKTVEWYLMNPNWWAKEIKKAKLRKFQQKVMHDFK
ncbi:dTDP-glucose 4,6-dehydratase [Candidatus Woesearchaeota archaeon]|nr:dTDP-glucose 4,6-dehydratase [Candidatus Woesearchaeota archaeon]